MRSATSRALITRNMGYLTEFKLLSGGVVLEGGHGEHVCEKEEKLDSHVASVDLQCG